MQTIPKEALEFLSAIKENNNREWFNERKEEFKAIENQMKQFYQQVELLLNKQDDIQRTRAYRFYRDLRFTKDKTPYKKHFADRKSTRLNSSHVAISYAVFCLK